MTNVLIFVGLWLFAMQLAGLGHALLLAWRKTPYRRRSGVPLVGSLLLTLGLMLNGSLAAWWPFPVELLFTVSTVWLFWKIKPEQKMEE
jgi:hypothetical protein